MIRQDGLEKAWIHMQNVLLLFKNDVVDFILKAPVRVSDNETELFKPLVKKLLDGFEYELILTTEIIVYGHLGNLGFRSNFLNADFLHSIFGE